jgi:hypothetical protein
MNDLIEKFEILKQITLPQAWMFYGASVTQQKLGYVKFFSLFLADVRPSIRVIQRGFGSMHLKEAVLLFDKVVAATKTEQKQFSVCFLEWYTGYPRYSEVEVEEFLTLLIENFVQIDVVPVFLFLYNHEDPKERLLFKARWLGLALKRHIPFVDMEFLGSSYYGSRYFRDQTHLTEEGGKFFGQQLLQILQFPPIRKEEKQQIFRLKRVLFRSIPYDLRRLEKKTQISEMSFVAQSVDLQNPLILPSDRKGIVVAFWLIVGAESGWIEIKEAETGRKESMLVWDRWCHYDRFMIRNLRSEFSLAKKVSIHLLDLDPPYETCREKLPLPYLTKEKRRLWIIGFSFIPEM